MYEDIHRKRTNLHSARQTAVAPRRAGKIGYVGFQIAVCLLCIIAAVVIRLAGGGVYTLVKAQVSKALDTPVTGSDISQVFAAIKSGLPDVSKVFDSSSSDKAGSGVGSSSGGSSSEGSSSASSKKSGVASSGVSSSSTPSNSSAPAA